MRRMWLWVLLYALWIGFILLFFGMVGWGPPLSGIAGDIRQIAVMVGGGAALGGFVVCLAGMILLLIRRTVAVGRVVSLIGIGFSYVAALAFVLASFAPELLSPSWGSLEVISSYIFIAAVFIGLPGFFIMRKLRHLLKKDEYIKLRDMI